MINILIAEDDTSLCRLYSIVLEKAGYHTFCANDGQEAWDTLDREHIDLVITDIMMPVMNGYEAAKMIRSLDREDAKVIPIIAMTANAFTEDKMRAKEAGMDEHIAKPVDGKLLVKVINELVKRNQREKL